MARAHVMVSDLSGIVFDFVFLFERPVITLRYDVNKIGLEASDLPWDPWELTVLDSIGTRIEEDEVEGLPSLIEGELAKSDRREEIRRLRMNLSPISATQLRTSRKNWCVFAMRSEQTRRSAGARKNPHHYSIALNLCKQNG